MPNLNLAALRTHVWVSICLSIFVMVVTNITSVECIVSLRNGDGLLVYEVGPMTMIAAKTKSLTTHKRQARGALDRATIQLRAAYAEMDAAGDDQATLGRVFAKQVDLFNLVAATPCRSLIDLRTKARVLEMDDSGQAGWFEVLNSLLADIERLAEPSARAATTQPETTA
jgi:hypothetical protein